MNQPNQRGGGGGFRQAQQASPLAIRTKKSQLTTDAYTKMVMGEVWKKDWVYALIPFVLGLLPAIFLPSWWWIALAVVLTILFVLFRSAQVTGITQMEQSKPLFERMAFEMDNKQLLLRVGPEKEGKAMQLNWDMIDRARRDADAYLLYLKPGTPPEGLAAWRLWLARTFDVPVFLHLPQRIFNSPNDLKLFEALLRRKNLLPAEAGATTV
ncbi:YcxB family protein [Hymenobacter sp. 5317J-9]|uniref:YcxB family protein n=1 Tax=Hymenobacter sp. 5317J-9 TaxID=2932250 RepID=UPI001FD63364|nr:YcxB family protein [Hymenobacter sp. 5317J-9]UOQ97865.1 YcxB family protein [Hymenobacter sp. 5317J-9]